jgi:hypothetical protein
MTEVTFTSLRAGRESLQEITVKLLRAIPHEPKEVRMNAPVVTEFGMESSCHRPALTDEYGVSTMSGEDFHSGSDFFDSGSSDKDHF